jgi:hypothetical protein
MTTHDPIADALFEYTPTSFALTSERDTSWERILRDAGLETNRRIWSRHRWGFRAVVAIAVALVAAGAAVAAGLRANWFDGGPPAISSVVEIAAGTTPAGPWTLKAYASSTDGICLRAVVDEGGFESCGAGVRGEPVTPTSKTQRPDEWVGFSYGSLFPRASVSIVTGPVAKQVPVVQIEFADGTTALATVVPAPSSLGSNISFYYLIVRPRPLPTAVVAMREDGSVIVRRPIHLPSIVTGMQPAR